jgi:hypothetical protein
MKNVLSLIAGLSLIAAPFILATTAYANDDRDATAEEKAQVVETLQQNDCPTVGDVDYTQGLGFEAEDVKCNDGKEYDVVLDDNFAIVSKREDAD